MSQRFKLAANVLLSKRLRSLLRIDDNVEIDKRYITCAEYQLFIDQMRAAGKNRQPDHWKTKRFLSGDAKKPILGVRGSDAEEFCEWLTQQQLALGVRYRLPTLAEATLVKAETEEYPATDGQVGCWCQDGDKLVIAGIDSVQWQAWQQKLSEVLILNHIFNRDLSLDLKRDLNLDLNLDLNSDFNRDLKCDLKYDLNRNLKCDIYRDLNLNLNLVLYRVFNRGLNIGLNHNICRDLKRDLKCDIYRILNHCLNPVFKLGIYHDLKRDVYRDIHRDLNSDIYRILNRYLNRYLSRVLNRFLYQKIEADEACDLLLLYFPLLLVIIIYHLLSVIYKQISKEDRKALNLDERKCKAISDNYANRRDEVFPLYIFLALLDERQQEQMPVWEGIRIVRERVDS